MIRTKRIRVLGVALSVSYTGSSIGNVSTTHAEEITALLSQTTLDRIRTEVLGKPGTEEMIYEDLATGRGPFVIPTPKPERVDRNAVVRLFNGDWMEKGGSA